MAGASFAVAVALAIVITGPLLLFNPWFVAFEQGRHGVPEAVGAGPDEVARVTNSLLADLFTGGDFAVSLDGVAPYLTADERSHMSDVGGLVRILVVVGLAALVLSLAAGFWLRRDRDLRGRLLLSAAAVVGLTALGLALFFAVAFDTAFALFHTIFFAAGSWQFPPGSPLITLFPEPFWFEVALVAGGTIVVAAGIVAWLGWRDLRAVPASG